MCVYDHTGLIPGYQSIAKYHQDIDTVVIQFINTTEISVYQHWGLSEIVYNRVVKILRKANQFRYQSNDASMMKKFNTKGILLLFSFLVIGCADSLDESDITTYKSIKSVEALLYSFDENGDGPIYSEFDIERIGMSVYPDSTVTEFEARVKPDVISYTNFFDSLNFFTVHYFDDEHPAGSNINDLLLVLFPSDNDQMLEVQFAGGLTTKGNDFKLNALPQNDSLQFIVSGRIIGEGTFSEKTQLVILN